VKRIRQFLCGLIFGHWYIFVGRCRCGKKDPMLADDYRFPDPRSYPGKNVTVLGLDGTQSD